MQGVNMLLNLVEDIKTLNTTNDYEANKSVQDGTLSTRLFVLRAGR